MIIVKGARGDDGQTEKNRGGCTAVVAKQYAFKDPLNTTPTLQSHMLMTATI